MALILEDGTGLPTANAYCDVAWVDAWATDRNSDVWMKQSPTLKAKFIIQATDFIDKNFRFMGVRSRPAQNLEFPRRGIPLPSSAATFYNEIIDGLFFSWTEVPVNVKRACAEVAIRVASYTDQGLNIQPDPAENATGTIIEHDEQVGTLRERTKWSGQVPNMVPYYPAAVRWLRDFMTGGNPIERA